MTATETSSTDRILEARAIACQHRANGNEALADVWDEKVNRLLDQHLVERPPAA